MTIKNLVELVNGRMVPASGKLDSSLLHIANGALKVTANGLDVDLSTYASKDELATAIAQAQIGASSGEIDLSAYATKTEVASVESKLDLVLNSAPEAFDTFKEIADWIANDENEAADLLVQIAQKADKTVVDELVLNQEAFVLKEAGKGLSDENFTAEYKQTLSQIPEAFNNMAAIALAKQAKIETVSNTVVNTTTVNSIPLYTLNNNGEYVLCTPDYWLSVGDNLFIPGYRGTTIGVSSAGGS